MVEQDVCAINSKDTAEEDPERSYLKTTGAILIGIRPGFTRFAGDDLRHFRILTRLLFLVSGYQCRPVWHPLRRDW